MDMEHRVWSGAIQTLEKLLLGTRAYVLLLSHFTRVLESWNYKARRVIRQVQLQISLVECKVMGLIPQRTVSFSHFQSHGNDCTMQCAYSDACWVQIV